MLIFKYKIEKKGDMMKNIKMGKNNKLILGLLAILLTMSVGYAIFSDSIKVTGTAVARSDWGFTVNCTKSLDSKFFPIFEINSADELGEFGYENDTCTVSGNSVTIDTTLKMPTASRMFTVSIKNTGGVDAVILADHDYDPSPYKLQLYNKSDNSLYKEYVDGTDSNFNTVINNYARIGVEGAVVEDVNGNIMPLNYEQDDLLKQKDMIYEDTEGNYYVKIAPNETLYIFIYSYWGESAVSTNYYSKTIGTYNFDLTQLTTDLKVAPNGHTCFGGC